MGAPPGVEIEEFASAWYAASRLTFVDERSGEIADRLAGRAAREGLDPGPDQHLEWQHSVHLLQEPLRCSVSPEELHARLQIVRDTVAQLDAIKDVVLEFDFRRRGLRIDCLLLAEGALFVVEFKRSTATAADRDQVMNYAINLLEFHRETREWAAEGALVVPLLVLTDGRVAMPTLPAKAAAPWPSLFAKPMTCGGATGLIRAIERALGARSTTTQRARSVWLRSSFSPSSTIIDAALSLYGQHDVAAIEAHAAPKRAIDESTAEIADVIRDTLARGEHRVIFLSGAPGSGKTLVGLKLAFSSLSFSSQAVFVTGNAPLVEVLQKALQGSYLARSKGASTAFVGYPKIGFKPLLSASTFKIVKAHQFLGERGKSHGQEDGRVVVFDEAQRTYEKGRQVLRRELPDHEADLILEAQRKQFPDGSVVVALIGHNQAINRGEQGIRAWFEAAERQGWAYSVGNDTLALVSEPSETRWQIHPLRSTLMNGHLRQSMRFYRNEAIERWVGEVLEGSSTGAAEIAARLDEQASSVWLTRSLDEARTWARANAVGGQRSGLIGSGQGRRLAAHGLFVDLKPDIATWMLAATADYRSSSALELVQNQFQVQGLELDYTIVCWDLDLRRAADKWAAFKLNGARWSNDRALEFARNSYRVLLTRARKGMIVFVPPGDLSREDDTRPPEAYDEIANHLTACGARSFVG